MLASRETSAARQNPPPKLGHFWFMLATFGRIQSKSGRIRQSMGAHFPEHALWSIIRVILECFRGV